MVDEIQGSLYFGSFINAKIETPKKGGKQGEARTLTLSLKGTATLMITVLCERS